MIEADYSIDEILNAIDEIQKLKKEKKIIIKKEENVKTDITNIPKNTLKLIEEAEKSNN